MLTITASRPSGDVEVTIQPVEEGRGYDRLVYESLADWPGSFSIRPKEIRKRIESSMDNFDPRMLLQQPMPQIPYAMVIFQDDAGEFVGFCEWSFLQGDVTGFDIHRLAFHPSKRGLGWFRVFSNGIAYLANQVMQADGACFSYFAETQAAGGHRIGPDDKDLKDRILRGEIVATELPDRLTSMRERMGVRTMDVRMPEMDARLTGVTLDRETVGANLFNEEERARYRLTVAT